MTQTLLDSLEALATIFPLPVFSFIGSFIEEIIAPIPSPFVMTGAGSIAHSQDQVLFYLVLLAILGALGKTIGSVIIYFIADKGEDVILTKFGKFIGVSHREVEMIGKHLNHGWRDDVILFVIRAIPLMPSGPVSAVCGLIKINIRTFVVTTFLGSIVRNLIYLYIGYQGLAILSNLDQLENLGKYVLLLAIIVGLGWIVYRRRQRV